MISYAEHQRRLERYREEVDRAYNEKLAEIRGIPRSLTLSMLAKAFAIFAPYLDTSIDPCEIAEPMEGGPYYGTFVVRIPYHTVSHWDRLRLAELCWDWGQEYPTEYFYLRG